MKVIDAIMRVDAAKPNGYSNDDKIRWLADLDGKIKCEVIDTHEGGDAVEFHGYTSEAQDAELLVPAPYDDLYIRWLEARIDFANQEIGKYTNSMISFNAAYSDFARQYNRVNMPKGGTIRYF